MLWHTSHLNILQYFFLDPCLSHFNAFFFPKETIHIQFLFTNSGSLWVPEKGCSVVPICVVFHSLLINLPPFADSFVLSTRNRFQLFMPIFHKYLGDGISKQTMPGDTNPHLQQRSFNALEDWPAVDRHLLLSSAALQQQCWHSKNVCRSSAALTLHWDAGIILKERKGISKKRTAWRGKPE